MTITAASPLWNYSYGGWEPVSTDISVAAMLSNATVTLAGGFTGMMDGLYFCVLPSVQVPIALKLLYANGTVTYPYTETLDGTACASLVPDTIENVLTLYVDNISSDGHPVALGYAANNSVLIDTPMYFYGGVITFEVDGFGDIVNVSETRFGMDNPYESFPSGGGPSVQSDGTYICANDSVLLTLNGVSSFYVLGELNVGTGYTVSHEGNDVASNFSLNPYYAQYTQQTIIYFDSGLELSANNTYSFTPLLGIRDCLYMSSIVTLVSLLNDSAPSQTSQILGSPAGTPIPTPTSTYTSHSDEPIIVGAVVGPVAAISLVICLFLIIQRRQSRNASVRFGVEGRVLDADELEGLPTPFYHDANDSDPPPRRKANADMEDPAALPVPYYHTADASDLPPRVKNYQAKPQVGTSPLDRGRRSVVPPLLEGDPPSTAVETNEDQQSSSASLLPLVRTVTVPFLDAMQAIYTVPLATLVDALNHRLREPESEEENELPPDYEDETHQRRRRRRSRRRRRPAARPVEAVASPEGDHEGAAQEKTGSTTALATQPV